MHLVFESWVVSAFSSSSKPPIFFSFFTRLFTAFSGQILSDLSSPFFRSRRRLITGADGWKTAGSIDMFCQLIVLYNTNTAWNGQTDSAQLYADKRVTQIRINLHRTPQTNDFISDKSQSKTVYSSLPLFQTASLSTHYCLRRTTYEIVHRACIPGYPAAGAPSNVLIRGGFRHVQHVRPNRGLHKNGAPTRLTFQHGCSAYRVEFCWLSMKW